MKAMMMKEYMKLEIVEIPIPEIRANEVLVKIKVASVCGSDIHGMNGNSKRRQPPIIMGHEASGVIEEVGKDVAGFAVGDRVTFDSTVYCGECGYCKSQQINLCDHRMVLGASTGEYRRHGAYAEYIAIPAHILYKLDDAISFEDAAMVEPMSVALHAIHLLPPVKDGCLVLFGTGTIALFAVQLLKLQDFNNVVVVGRNHKNLQLAKELGADLIVDSTQEDPTTAVMNYTKQVGADLAYDAAGAQSTFDSAIHCLRKGGHFVTIANLTPEFTIDMLSLITRQLTIHGSCASNGENEEILTWLKEGKIRTDYVISAKISLEEAPEYLLRIHHKEIPEFQKLLILPEGTGPEKSEQSF
jgi:L-iditol 2-dehydrogenase